MEEYFEEKISHKRSKKKHLRVTFEDGKSICYTSTTMTFMEYQKELVRGWYVMTQSDSEQKYRQLLAIKELLSLDIKVELGEDFETDKVKMFQKSKRSRGALLVKFPDGEYIGGENPIDTYKETILKIGIDELKRRRIELGGKPLIASTDVTKAYTEIEPSVWIATPSTTKEKVKYLKIIGSFMRIPLEVTIID